MAKSSKGKESSKNLSAAHSAAKASLDQQLASKGITKEQYDAEWGRLKGLSESEVGAANQAAAPAAPAGNQPAPNYAALPRPFGDDTLPVSPVVGDATPLKTPQNITNAQGALDERYISQQLALNRPGEVTPFGTSQYVQTPDGRVIRVSNIGDIDPTTMQNWVGDKLSKQLYLDREMQGIAGDMLPQMRGMLSSPFNYDGISAAPNSDSFADERARVENELYNRYATVQEPLFKKQLEDFQQQMADRGIAPGNELYNKQFQELQRAQNDARSQARTASIATGGQEQQRQFENAWTARNAGIGERLAQRQQPFADMRGLLGMVNPQEMPSFSGIAGIDVARGDIASPALQQLGFENSLQLAKMGGGGGGGMHTDPFALASHNAKLQAERDERLFQQQQLAANANKPKSSDMWGSIGGAALGSFLGGLGQSFGSGWGQGFFS